MSVVFIGLFYCSVIPLHFSLSNISWYTRKYCSASIPVFRQCSGVPPVFWCSVSVPVFRVSVFRSSVFWCSWFYSIPDSKDQRVSRGSLENTPKRCMKRWGCCAFLDFAFDSRITLKGKKGKKRFNTKEGRGGGGGVGGGRHGSQKTVGFIVT